MGAKRKKMITLETTRWGTLKLDPNEVLSFPKGLPGFEGCKQFVIFRSMEFEPFQWLISLDQKDLGFIIINPFCFCPDYKPKILPGDLEELKLEKEEDLLIYTIVTLAPNVMESTANLRGPILINTRRRVAKQVILADEKYPVKYPIIKNDKYS